MVNDLGHKIRRSKERLKLTQLEQAAAAGISPVSLIINIKKFWLDLDSYKNLPNKRINPPFANSCFF